MGYYKREQSLLYEVCVWPSVVIVATPSSLSSLMLAQYGAKSHSYPSVHPGKYGAMAMLEIVEPSPQDGIQLRDDLAQTVAVVAPSVLPYPVPEFAQALLAGPFLATLKVIPQKVESTCLAGIDYLGLLWVQLQTHRQYPFLHHPQRFTRFFLIPA